jgi:dTDP-4-amino-4,6-dideoxygalactose transaminase
MIPVTKPFVPPIEEYNELVKGIFEREWFTNHGPLVLELEDKLKKRLELPYLWYLNNGTIAIQIAIKALELNGEVITTPFSYVATTSSLVWENCTPVFADIDPNTLTIDPQCVEALITDKTTGILATHVYGIPCAVDELEAIAKKHNLKIIYDAAHAFGVTYKGKSLFEYGDISTTSFHATKLFHTAEGGAVITTNKELADKMALLRNFGHTSPTSFNGAGINGKSSEFHAAMGLTVLNHIDNIIAKLKQIFSWYDEKLSGLPIRKPVIPEGTNYNYAYYAVILESEEALLNTIKMLNDNDIIPRRYFFPSLNKLDYLTEKYSCPVSESISTRVLCLPLYYQLTEEEVNKVVKILSQTVIYA